MRSSRTTKPSEHRSITINGMLLLRGFSPSLLLVLSDSFVSTGPAFLFVFANCLIVQGQRFHASLDDPGTVAAAGRGTNRPHCRAAQQEEKRGVSVQPSDRAGPAGVCFVCNRIVVFLVSKLFTKHPTTAHTFRSFFYTVQVLSVLLERQGHGALAEKIIYLAGHKVTTDPFAIPFSMVSDSATSLRRLH